jgi:hypothetical protein
MMVRVLFYLVFSLFEPTNCYEVMFSFSLFEQPMNRVLCCGFFWFADLRRLVGENAFETKADGTFLFRLQKDKFLLDWITHCAKPWADMQASWNEIGESLDNITPSLPLPSSSFNSVYDPLTEGEQQIRNNEDDNTEKWSDWQYWYRVPSIIHPLCEPRGHLLVPADFISSLTSGSLRPSMAVAWMEGGANDRIRELGSTRTTLSGIGRLFDKNSKEATKQRWNIPLTSDRELAALNPMFEMIIMPWQKYLLQTSGWRRVVPSSTMLPGLPSNISPPTSMESSFGPAPMDIVDAGDSKKTNSSSSSSSSSSSDLVPMQDDDGYDSKDAKRSVPPSTRTPNATVRATQEIPKVNHRSAPSWLEKKLVNRTSEDDVQKWNAVFNNVTRQHIVEWISYLFAQINPVDMVFEKSPKDTLAEFEERTMVDQELQRKFENPMTASSQETNSLKFRAATTWCPGLRYARLTQALRNLLVITGLYSRTMVFQVPFSNPTNAIEPDGDFHMTVDESSSSIGTNELHILTTLALRFSNKAPGSPIQTSDFTALRFLTNIFQILPSASVRFNGRSNREALHAIASGKLQVADPFTTQAFEIGAWNMLFGIRKLCEQDPFRRMATAGLLLLQQGLIPKHFGEVSSGEEKACVNANSVLKSLLAILMRPTGFVVIDKPALALTESSSSNSNTTAAGFGSLTGPSAMIDVDDEKWTPITVESVANRQMQKMLSAFPQVTTSYRSQSAILRTLRNANVGICSAANIMEMNNNTKPQKTELWTVDLLKHTLSNTGMFLTDEQWLDLIKTMPLWQLFVIGRSEKPGASSDSIQQSNASAAEGKRLLMRVLRFFHLMFRQLTLKTMSPDRVLLFPLFIVYSSLVKPIAPTLPVPLLKHMQLLESELFKPANLDSLFLQKMMDVDFPSAADFVCSSFAFISRWRTWQHEPELQLFLHDFFLPMTDEAVEDEETSVRKKAVQAISTRVAQELGVPITWGQQNDIIIALHLGTQQAMLNRNLLDPFKRNPRIASASNQTITAEADQMYRPDRVRIALRQKLESLIDMLGKARDMWLQGIQDEYAAVFKYFLDKDTLDGYKFIGRNIVSTPADLTNMVKASKGRRRANAADSKDASKSDEDLRNDLIQACGLELDRVWKDYMHLTMLRVAMSFEALPESHRSMRQVECVAITDYKFTSDAEFSLSRSNSKDDELSMYSFLYKFYMDWVQCTESGNMRAHVRDKRNYKAFGLSAAAAAATSAKPPSTTGETK